MRALGMSDRAPSGLTPVKGYAVCHCWGKFMRRSLSVALCSCAFILSIGIVGTHADAMAMLDQSNNPLGNQSFGLSSEVYWQQGITAGRSGKLSSVDLYFLDAGEAEFSLYGSGPWNVSAPTYRSVVTVNAGWNSIDLRAANFAVTSGNQFSIGLHGAGAPETGGPSFGGSHSFDTLSGFYDGGELWWQFQDQYGRSNDPQGLGLPFDAPNYDIGFRTFVDTLAMDAAPTVLELAKLSDSVYRTDDLAGYSYINTDLGLGFGAAAFKKGDQVVVAFRGTDFSAIDVAKDIFSDSSFVTGDPSNSLESYTEQAAKFLAEVQAANQGATITLTGHSLGGALAQLAGEVSGYRVVSFDAPGAEKLLHALEDELEVAKGLSSAPIGEIVNYRLSGDQISLVGDQIGETKTVGSLSEGDDDISWSEALGVIAGSHSIDNLIDELDNESPLITNGVDGPVLDPLRLINFVGKSIGDGFDVFHFSPDIESLVDFGFDPPGGSEYVFIGDSRSPLLLAIQLPNMRGVSSFSFAQFDGTWGEKDNIDPLTWYDFNPGVTGFSLTGINALGRKVNMNGPVLFDLRFQSSGQLIADLTVFDAASAVPEPFTWALMILGFGAIGLKLRTQRHYVGDVLELRDTLRLGSVPV